MSSLVALVGLLLILVCLWETFETVILPRRVTRRVRLTGYFYRSTWRLFQTLAARLPDPAREGLLSYYGPLSLILLLGIWVVGLVLGFALLHTGLGTEFTAPEGPPGFAALVYHSGETFFTLGFGDIAPRDPLGRLVAVIEAGTGFAFLAVVIAYLPIFYQAFSRREVTITLLDARAGSPPCAAELLRRQASGDGDGALEQFLHEWERWSAELLESHLSYPLLGYFRSQHERESWVAALTTILDTCLLLMVGVASLPSHQARLTFAMARHAAADLSQIFSVAPRTPEPGRLPPAELRRLRAALAEIGLPLADGPEADEQLVRLRALYEPYVAALAHYLRMPLPAWLPAPNARDDWQITAWDSGA